MTLERRRDEGFIENFCDVQIHCRNIILPAHRYVLSCSCSYLAEQLASGVAKLNWTDFEEPTCIALLRWIYTNKVVFSPNTDVTAEQWQGLLLASYKLELVSLFTICEGNLLTLLGDESLCRFRRLYGISKKVGANQMMQKCSVPRLNVPDAPPEEPKESFVSLENMEAKMAKFRADSDCPSSEKSLDDCVYEQMASEFRKFASGYNEFQKFSDMDVVFENREDCRLRVHAHVLGNRIERIRERLETADVHFETIFGFDGFQSTLLRWVYTDCIILDDYLKEGLLRASRIYDIPALFERCEDDLLVQVDIHSCVYFREMAKEQNSSRILERCNQVIAKYFNKPQTPHGSLMNYEDSFNEVMVSESPTEAVEGLLVLNDDCLLHIFRLVSVMDLGSIKDTCKRLRPLADQSFRLRKIKSLKISSDSIYADVWVLKHFGKFIKSLSVDSFYERHTSLGNVLEQISKCTGEELKSIAFRNLRDKKSNSFECLKTVLKTVECIELKWVHDDTIVNSLLDFCENLREIHIGGHGMQLNSDWCVRNPNVIKLSLDGLANDLILKNICKMLKRLKSLSVKHIRLETGAIFHLGRLRNLKKLRVDSSMMDEALERFIDKTVLEDLTLLNVQLTGPLVNVLGEFQNLSNLAFDFCRRITSKDIIEIIGKLLGLKNLSLTNCFNFDAIDRDDYLRLDKTRNINIFLDHDVYTRSCELIGNSMSINVQIKRHP